jgi:hypothetical protein
VLSEFSGSPLAVPCEFCSSLWQDVFQFIGSGLLRLA